MRVLKQKQYMKNWHVKSFLYWSLVILFSWLLQIALAPPLFAQRPPAANEVAVYEHINYVGTQRIYALEPGMRQKFVPHLTSDIDQVISSIQVGANVGVMFFTSYNFGGSGNVTLQSINTLPPEYNDKISSLIIFPKEWLSPVGVLMVGKSRYSGLTMGRFFPAPEKMADRTAFYPYIGDDLNDNSEVARVWPDSLKSPVYNQIWVKLCEDANYGGKCITIPGPGGSPLHTYQLYDYQSSNKTSSLQVTHNYPISVKSPPAQSPSVQTPPVRMPIQRR
jgi:hypothetical protein